jgi:exopolysaccharide production protein ExoQ
MKSIGDLLMAWPLLLSGLFIGVGLVVALVTSIALGAKFRVEWMGLYFIAVPAASVMGVLVKGRDLSRETALPFQPDSADLGLGDWASRGITLLCLAIAAERAFRFLMLREYRESRGNALMGALLVYLLSANILPSLLGTPGGIDHHLVSTALVVLAGFAYAQSQSERCIVTVRNTLFMFLLVSLLCLVFRPEMVMNTTYRNGILPSFTLRFYGFASHPNSLGPFCFLLMACLRLKRFDLAPLNLLAWLMALSSIALSQSKTVIVLVLMALGYLWFLDQRQKALDHGAIEHRNWQAATLTSVVLFLALVGILVLALQIGGADPFANLESLNDEGQLYTLTGRTTIWAETLKIFYGNPLFGYGPDLWGVNMRIRTGMLFATQAHNQFLHTLAAAGIVGLVALLYCLGALAVAAWRARLATRGVSLALFFFLFLRGVTEVPMNVGNPMQPESLFLMVLLVVCVAGLRARSSARSQVAALHVAHYQRS